MPKLDVRKEDQKWWVFIDDIPYRSFETEVDALIEKARLQELLLGMKRSGQHQGSGTVLDFEPGNSWIQKRGRVFVVQPPTDLDLKVGEKVQVDKYGKVSRVPERDPAIER
jgi:hypothetical protein